MSPTMIGFRATAEDERVLRANALPGETTSDTLRRAVQLLDYHAWLDQARADSSRLRDEDLSAEPEEW